MRAEYERQKAAVGRRDGVRPLVRRRREQRRASPRWGSTPTGCPQFTALLAAEDGDLPRFYARVKALAALPKAEREAALAAVAARS